MPEFETSETQLGEASITMNSPGDSLGANFRLQGTAIVRMRTAEFIKVRGTGKTFVFDTFVTTGFRVRVRLGQTDHDAVVAVNGNSLLWSFDVEGATAGPLAIKATLSGTVQESQTKTQNGETQHTSKTVPVTRTASLDVTIDPVPPELELTVISVPVGPPYRALFEGTASDAKGLTFVGAHFANAVTAAEQLLENWTSWRAVVALPDRDHDHTIAITAEDTAGNVTAREELIAADSSPPFVSILKPPTNPLLVLVPAGGTIDVEVLAASNHTTIRIVRFRIDGGEEKDADNGTGGLVWRFQVTITAPGVHVVEITAMDERDKVSVPFELVIKSQIQA